MYENKVHIPNFINGSELNKLQCNQNQSQYNPSPINTCNNNSIIPNLFHFTFSCCSLTMVILIGGNDMKINCTVLKMIIQG